METKKEIILFTVVTLGFYVFFAFLMPWMSAFGRVFHYEARKWACEKNGGTFGVLEVKNVRYNDCLFPLVK